MSEGSGHNYSRSLALYEKLVASNPEIERKGATMPYTSINGHMFSFLAKDGVLALRLPSGEREEFLERYDAGLMEQYGRVMKEYVSVPDELLGNTEELVRYFDVSYSYVASLKPKATKR